MPEGLGCRTFKEESHMQWFEAIAPIRLKMIVAFGLMIGLMIVNLTVSLFGLSWPTFLIQVVVTGAATMLAARLRNAICDPYVNTVVRMEGLAAGDLTTPLVYGHHKDCVGRMTNAMQTFRATALRQQQHAAEQAEVVAVFGEHLSQLTAGNLTAEIERELPDGYAELKCDFNAALESLRTLIGSVAGSAQAIRTGSSEIAQASEDLSRRTEANAESLEQTTVSISQIDARLKATAGAAKRTVVRADDAISTVVQGRSTAADAVLAMTRVTENAKGIDSVIEGLDKIAFQTRVLAMNAAVEAGRAGDAGRGFTVVADLVSALAKRSEEESARARAQLTASQSDIVEAMEMVRKVDGALERISSGVTEVHSLLGQIAEDNQAQSLAISKISVAIGTMDEATQQNAAMVEETSAAARNLSGEVSTLSEQASKFEIGASAQKVVRRNSAASKHFGEAKHSSRVKPASAAVLLHADNERHSSF
jgi:methyl-accepting chemotaxis protein